MYIKLTKIDFDADMSGYDAIEITGKKLDDGETWVKGFFANNDELKNQLNDFVVGDDVNVLMEQSKKNKKWWNISGFKEMTQEDRDNLEKPRGAKSGGYSKGKGGTGSGLSKEEWAEKDRKADVGMAKSVAVKVAVAAGKKTAASIIKLADELLPYLLDKSPIKTEDDDALDPPV